MKKILDNNIMPKRNTQKRGKKANKYMKMIETLIDQQRSGILRKTLNYTSRKLKLGKASRRRR